MHLEDQQKEWEEYLVRENTFQEPLSHAIAYWSLLNLPNFRVLTQKA